MQNCNVKVNLAYIPDHYQFKKISCCIKFAGKSIYEYACVENLNCQYWALAFAGRLSKQCTMSKNIGIPTIINENYLGYHVGFKQVLNSLQTLEFNTYRMELSFEKEMLDKYRFVAKWRSKMYAYIQKAKRMMQKLNKQEIIKNFEISKEYQISERLELSEENSYKMTNKWRTQTKDFAATFHENDLITYQQLYDAGNKKLVIINGNLYFKTKEFILAIIPESQYLFMHLIEESYYFEMKKSGKNIFTQDHTKLSPEFNSSLII